MRTNKHETAVKKVKVDHKANKVKRTPKEPNMGDTKKKMGKNNGESLNPTPSSQNGYSTKATKARKHRMEAMTQETGMSKPKRSKY